MALESSDPAMGMSTVNGAAAMARRPWPQEAAARNRCRSRATWASGQAGHHERRCLSPWPWRPNVPLVGDEARRVGGGRRRRGRVRSRSRRRGGPRVPTALSTGSGPARLAGPGLGTARRARRPASRRGAVPGGTADRGEAAGAACQRSRSRLREQSVSPPPTRSATDRRWRAVMGVTLVAGVVNVLTNIRT